ncbi:YacC family pilotin-like protein [Klebsiella quasipneumoniae subsp. similipneumoniae]
MKTLFRTMVLAALLALPPNSYALSESEAEDMADLTAVLCSENDWLPEPAQHADPSRAGVLTQQNQWDLSNYDSYNMKALGEDSYRDLSGINILTAKNVKRYLRFAQPAGLR